MNESARTA